MRINTRTFIYYLLALVILLSTSSGFSETETADEFEELKFHVIYNEELRDIMQRLNILIYESNLNTLKKEELMKTIDELMFSSITMTEALPGFELSIEESDIFQAMAMQLKKEAHIIKQMSEQNDKINMQRSYIRLNDTCDACHELFRF